MLIDFLRKIKEDAIRLFYYPTTRYGERNTVDYNAYWHVRRGKGVAVLSRWQKQRADYVLSIIENGVTVLDLGCGDGAVLTYMREKKGVKGVGVDVSPEILSQAHAQGIETILLDITKPETLQTLPEVDYIIGLEIIEHMPNAEEVLWYLLEKARKGVIFSVPNTGYYAHRLRLLFGSVPLQWAAHPGEHLRFWTVRDMKFWITSLGVRLERLHLYEGLPVLNKIWPSLFAQGMVVAITKK